MADNENSSQASNKPNSWATFEEEVFNTIVNYHPIEAKKSIDDVVYGPLTESETKRLESIKEEEEERFVIPNIPSCKSDVMSRVNFLLLDDEPNEIEDSLCTLHAKDSAIIHFKNQKKSMDSFKHKLEICFKLPLKQEVMILENHKKHPVKESDDLKSKASEDVFLYNAASSSNSKDIHETKSVRFSEHMVIPIVDPKQTTVVENRRKEKKLSNRNRSKELQRLRLEVEQKRLEWLELKIERERESINRERERANKRSKQSLTVTKTTSLIEDSDI